LKVKRLNQAELNNGPKTDANYILIAEILLMTAFLFMNAADHKLQLLKPENYTAAGSFTISQYLVGLLPETVSSLIFVERFCWWFHIVGVLAFLNYLPL